MRSLVLSVVFLGQDICCKVGMQHVPGEMQYSSSTVPGKVS